MKAYGSRISKLQEELAMEKTLTERLCKDLEDPRNTDRWTALPGVTPDPEALLTKIEVRQKWICTSATDVLYEWTKCWHVHSYTWT